MNASGIDPTRNGASARHEMWPRRQNRNVTKLATTMLSARAVGLAIPEVDELAAIPLTLWADERGYAKLSRNIFGS